MLICVNLLLKLFTKSFQKAQGKISDLMERNTTTIIIASISKRMINIFQVLGITWARCFILTISADCQNKSWRLFCECHGMIKGK